MATVNKIHLEANGVVVQLEGDDLKLGPALDAWQELNEAKPAKVDEPDDVKDVTSGDFSFGFTSDDPVFREVEHY